MQSVGCGNVILSSVYAWLTTLKTFTCTQSSSPITLFASHWTLGSVKGIHYCGNWEIIIYIIRRWYFRLSETRCGEIKPHAIWNIKQLKPDRASCEIYIASPWSAKCKSVRKLYTNLPHAAVNFTRTLKLFEMLPDPLRAKQCTLRLCRSIPRGY